MGLFDKFKKKAQQAVNQAQGMAGMGQQQQQMPPQGQQMPPQGMQQQMPPQGMAPQAAAPQGPTFQWDGDVYALPQGWDGLSIDEWFYKHECLRDARLRSIAQTYFDHLLEEMVELCKVIGVEDPEIAGELLMGTIFRIEHEALMIPVEQFDEDKACRIIKRQLSAFLP